MTRWESARRSPRSCGTTACCARSRPVRRTGLEPRTSRADGVPGRPPSYSHVCASPCRLEQASRRTSCAWCSRGAMHSSRARSKPRRTCVTSGAALSSTSPRSCPPAPPTRRLTYYGYTTRCSLTMATPIYTHHLTPTRTEQTRRASSAPARKPHTAQHPQTSRPQTSLLRTRLSPDP